MKNDDLKSKPTEKLESQLKMIKIVTGMLTGVLIVLYAVIFYGLIMKDDKSTFTALLAVAISCSATIPIQLSSMKKIKSELASRSSG